MKFQEGRVLSGLKEGRQSLKVVPYDVGAWLWTQQAYGQTKERRDSIACCRDKKKAAYQKDYKGCEDVMREKMRSH